MAQQNLNIGLSREQIRAAVQADFVELYAALNSAYGTNLVPRLLNSGLSDSQVLDFTRANFADLYAAVKTQGLTGAPRYLNAGLSSDQLRAATQANFTDLYTLLGGANTINPALKASAQRIVDGYNAFTARTTMGVAPMMTVGSTYGNTLVPGNVNNVESPMYLATDATKVRSTGPVKQANAGFLPTGIFGNWITVADGGPTFRDGGSGWGYGLRTNSRYVEICVNWAATDPITRIYLRVNGQWAQASDYVMFTGAPDSQPYPVRFDFGSTASRDIEFFLPYNGNLFGFNVVTGSAVAPLSAPAVKLSYWADSYGAGGYSGLTNLKHTLWQVFAERLGCSDPVPESLGGQGYVQQVNSRTIGNRIADDASKITGLDSTFGYFSINDFSSPQATTISQTIAGLTALQAAMPPSTWIGWFVAFPADNGNNAARFAAYKSALQAAADKRTIIVDAPAVKLISISGTLPNGMTHDSPEGTHPGPHEIDYAGPWMADQFVAGLRAASGIS